jgi:Tfp pilus assembly protein PilO
MVLSKRERIIFAVTLVCVGLLIISEFVVDPVLARLDEMETQRRQLRDELEEAQFLLANHGAMQRKWRALVSDGLRSDAEAESKVLTALREWSGNAGLALSSIKPDRIASDKGLQEMIFTVAGKGTLESVSRFLWQIETAALPVKVRDIQLGSGSESEGTMSLQLHLSALYLGTPEGSSDAKQLEVDYGYDI